MLRGQGGTAQKSLRFELREASVPVVQEQLQKELYDADGRFRGELKGKGAPGLEAMLIPAVGWDGYAKSSDLLLDAYRPETLPGSGDWVLVLDALSGGK